MLIIGYDRYNVIVKGFNGTKITSGMAFGMIFAAWVYAFCVCTPPFIGWGNYALGKIDFQNGNLGPTNFF